MKWLRLSLIVLLSCWLATPGAADPTQQDFSAVFQGTGDAPYVLVKSTVEGENPIEVTDRGVWDGNALWLTQNIGSQNNAVAFNELVSGPYDQLVIGMDMQFSLVDPPDGGGADGFGLAYANSEIWGSDNSWPIPSFTPLMQKSPISRGLWGWASIFTPTDGMTVPRIPCHCTGMAPSWRREAWISRNGATSICWKPEHRSARKLRLLPLEPAPKSPSFSWISTADTARRRSKTTSSKG